MLRNGYWIWPLDLEVIGDLDENIFRGTLGAKLKRNGFKREQSRVNSGVLCGQLS